MIFFIFFLDQNNYKPLIIQYVKKEMHRELEFNGDISFALLPKLGVSLKHFSLSEYKSSKKFVTAEHIHLTLPLKPLLKNQLVIDEIIVKGLKGTLIRFADGRTNIDDLLSPDEQTMEFDLGEIRIEDATFVLHDAINKKQVALSGLTFGASKITNNMLNKLELETSGIMVNLGKKDKQNFVTKLNVPNLQFGKNNIESSHVKLAIKIANPTNKIYGTLFLSDITVTKNRFDSNVMALDLASTKDTQTVKFRMKSPLAGNFETQELFLPAIQASFNFIAPHLPNQPLGGNLTGKISVASLSERIKATLTGELEDSSIQATFDIAGFDKPAVNFDIAIDHLNTDRLQSQFSNNDTELKQTINAQPLDEPIDLSLLSDFDANGSIHIGTAQLTDTTLSGITFKIQSGKNKLNSAPIQLNSAN